MVMEALSKESTIDTTQEKTYGIKESQGRYFVINNEGERVCHITNKSLAETIQKLFELQKRASEERLSRSDFLALVSMLNCRKSVFLAAKQLSLKDAVANTVATVGYDTLEEARLYGDNDPDGVVMLFDDIERLLRGGARPIVFGADTEQLRPLLACGTEPQVVHVFKVPNDKAKEVHMRASILDTDDIMSMKPALVHTFIMLGKDKSGMPMCFHKAGPEIDEPMEIVSLEDVYIRNMAIPAASNTKANFLAVYGPVGEQQV